MRKNFGWVTPMLVLIAGLSYLTASQNTTTPVRVDSGNNARDIAVAPSTQTVILISSVPRIALSTITPIINEWRERQIVNMSNGQLHLYFNTSQFSTNTVFTSTCGVVLSSDTRGLGGGDSYFTSGDEPVYGIWSAATSTGAGAGGYEKWFDGKIKNY